jgi:uncharacterized surface protein with fasciclin (FAS1) repeats
MTASDLVTRNWIQTLSNISYPVDMQGTSTFIGPARIIEPDIAASNGYINIIDTVLMPAAPAR